ncbi:YwmB family TATA-box binding protein [Shouchella clausii]|uniref:YwmB family TATA-box binding protein n=1 Tax=Shouchella clausii TaxID=79880 RepID=UPI00280A7524|nr:YwmB family TATA-box binding protein [Shouchella clausii]WMM33889.1 YwmB family TATA-box binding protein [Shouchella clausii]
MQKMIKAGFLAFVIGICGAMVFAPTHEKNKDQLLFAKAEAMLELARQEQLHVISWQVRAKGNEEVVHSKGEYEQKVDAFAAEHPTFERQPLESNQDSWSEVFIQDRGNGLQEVVKWLAVKDEGQIILMKSYELIASAEESVFDQALLKERLNRLEMESALLFYQLTAETTTLNDDSLFATGKRYMEQLGATIQEVLKEETFVSLSAYNNEWDTGIALENGNNMNVQVALRQNPDLGQQTRVTLGTPIITTEY